MNQELKTLFVEAGKAVSALKLTADRMIEQKQIEAEKLEQLKPYMVSTYPTREDAITEQDYLRSILRKGLWSDCDQARYNENSKKGASLEQKKVNKSMRNHVDYVWRKLLDKVYPKNDEEAVDPAFVDDDSVEEQDTRTPMTKKRRIQEAVNMLKTVTREEIVAAVDLDNDGEILRRLFFEEAATPNNN